MWCVVFVGQLLHLVHTLLPPDCCDLTPALPTLMWYTVGASRLPSPPHLASMPTVNNTVATANYFVDPASVRNSAASFFFLTERETIFY